ncbi:MAG TPA: polymer-forming cytoskeletal family protein [Gammaproteobacteria bacterium]|nr:polymer-forming cytoskeletal family protein [Gammaproteobacteria bacterium]
MKLGGKKYKNTRVDTLIGQQTELRGNISFTGGLHIDGKIQGNVTADGDHDATLVLSDKGTIEGEVRAPFLIINGLVIGDLYASETIELAPNARITGNVYYEKIEMAMGAEVNGSLVHMDDAVDGEQGQGNNT